MTRSAFTLLSHIPYGVVRNSVAYQRPSSTVMAPHLSITHLANFLDGYLDEVGRAVSTDTCLYNLALRELEDIERAADVLGVEITALTDVERISREFQSIVEGFLGLNGRDRLSYYLIEYYGWFEAFHGANRVSRIECRCIRPEVEAQEIHLIENDGVWAYLSIITKSKKRPNPPYRTPSPFDPR